MANYVLDTLSLSSDPISRLSGVNELCSTDSWIIERIGDYNDFVLVEDDDNTNAICAENPANGTIQSYILKETTHTIDGVDHYSMCLTYYQLSTQLLNDISARFGFNTMAYKEKWQYARANHSHDYSMVNCVPHVSYDDVVNAYAPNTRIMTYNISRGGYDASHPVNIPGVVSTIKRGNPTIVCLQEVDNGCSDTGNIDFLAKIKAYMGPSWNSEFLSCFDLESGQHGLGIVYDSRTVSNASLSSQELLEDDGNGHPIKMQICKFTDFVVANVCMGSTNLSTQCENINNYFFGADSEYREKTIFLAGYFGVSSASDEIDELRKKFDIISLANDTSFVMVNKDRLKHLHNIKRLTIDDVSTTGHRPVMASFFYNDDHTKLDEWLASMKIWKLSSWEETKSNGRWNYNVLHRDYVPMQYDIYYPHIEFPKYQDIEIGEMRFFARNTLPTISSTTNPRVDETGLLYDSEYDAYWAYPNGQTITCQTFEFQDACRMYGNDRKDGNDTSFTVPLLDKFFRCCYPGMQHTTHGIEYSMNISAISKCDVIFLQDMTGSMAHGRPALKKQIRSFIRDIVTLYLGLPETNVGDAQYAVWGYGDETCDEAWYQPKPFVNTFEDFDVQIDSLQPCGGGDTDESTYQALYNALTKAKWREDAQGIIFVFTDMYTKKAKLARDIVKKINDTQTLVFLFCNLQKRPTYKNDLRQGKYFQCMDITSEQFYSGVFSTTDIVNKMNGKKKVQIDYDVKTTSNSIDVTPLMFFDSQTCVPNHKHTLVNPTIHADGSSDISFIDDFILSGSTIGTSSADQSTNLVHSGGVPNGHDTYLTEIQLEVKEWGSNTRSTVTDYSDQSLDKETYPTHQHMPAIVYVGKR